MLVILSLLLLVLYHYEFVLYVKESSLICRNINDHLNMVSWDFFLPDRSFQRYVEVLDLGIQAQLKPVPKRGLHSHMVFSIYFFSEIIMFVVCCDINLCLEC